jgi:hypothetical protein
MLSRVAQRENRTSGASAESALGTIREVSAALPLPMRAGGHQGILGAMGNPFGITLDDDRLRWAAAKGVPKSVIAAICLLHDERSVDEIVARLTTAELEQIIKIAGRSPQVYPPGAYAALKEERHRRSMKPPAACSRAMRASASMTLSTCFKCSAIRVPLRSCSSSAARARHLREQARGRYPVGETTLPPHDCLKAGATPHLLSTNFVSWLS